MMIGRRGFLKGLLGLALVGVSGRLIGGGTVSAVSEVVPANIPRVAQVGDGLTHPMPVMPTEPPHWWVLSKHLEASRMPVGTLMETSVMGADWLPCDGRLVSIEKYRDLFNVIGATYGCSPARFRLPDLRGRACS